MLFLSTRVVRFHFGAATHERAFGECLKSRVLLKTCLLVPIPGSMAILGEIAAAQGSAAVIRFGFWSQAVAATS